MTDKPMIDRKVGALDSCLIINRVISFLCDRFEDVVGLAEAVDRLAAAESIIAIRNMAKEGIE